MKKFFSLLLSFLIISSALTCLTVAASAESARTMSDRSGVPTIWITTVDGVGNTIKKADGYVDASVVITDTDGTQIADSVQFKVRGNSTTLADKKAFTFKFAKKKDVMGMGKGKKWALIANAFDPTLLRNYLAFEIADEFGLAYTSRQRIVELWVDDVFKGCYSMMEPVQEGSDRVDIDIESNNGMKDFLLEYEASRFESDVTYININGLRFALSEPEEPDDAQLAYITDVMQSIIDTVENGTQDEINQVIDIDSFAKYYLLNEYLKTLDFGYSSVFYYYKDNKLYAGPPWDYDLSLGNANAKYSAVAAAANNPEGLFANNKQIYGILCRYDWFYAKVKEVFAEYRNYLRQLGANGGRIDQLTEQYATVFARNYHEAGWSINRWWVNVQMAPFSTYEENVSFLKDWCVRRAAWLSRYFDIGGTEYLIGDTDGDGEVTIFDATVIQRFLADLTIPYEREMVIRNGDVDVSGQLEIYDVTFIQRYLAKLSVDCPIDQIIKTYDD